jgi:8-oxo-dGTP pyrophosphatase MutT (NUDIX family)
VKIIPMFNLSVEAEELSYLHQLFGVAPHRQHRLDVDTPFLNGENQLLTSGVRRAEICYVLHRGDPLEGVLLHRKVFYPETAFRLPTGGVHQGERVLETLAREIEEETGFCVDLSPYVPGQVAALQGTTPVTVQAFLGTLEYALDHRSQGWTHTFATYHFLVAAPVDAVPVPLDLTEQVAGWQWRSIRSMKHTAELLDTVGESSPQWSDWGRFRALSHKFVAEAVDRL